MKWLCLFMIFLGLDVAAQSTYRPYAPSRPLYRRESRRPIYHRPPPSPPAMAPQGHPGVMNTYLIADAEKFSQSSYAKSHPGETFTEGKMIYGWIVFEDEALAYGAIVPAGQSIDECWQWPKLHVYMRKNFMEHLPNVMPRKF